MSEYTTTSIEDKATIEWLSNPNNVAAVFKELGKHLPVGKDEIVVHDHQVYAAVGRVMMSRREYGRSKQEMRSAGMMDVLAGYLSSHGYKVKITKTPEESLSGVKHRKLKAVKAPASSSN